MNFTWKALIEIVVICIAIILIRQIVYRKIIQHLALLAINKDQEGLDAYLKKWYVKGLLPLFYQKMARMNMTAINHDTETFIALIDDMEHTVVMNPQQKKEFYQACCSYLINEQDKRVLKYLKVLKPLLTKEELEEWRMMKRIYIDHDKSLVPLLQEYIAKSEGSLKQIYQERLNVLIGTEN